jgi:hypothetical protein
VARHFTSASSERIRFNSTTQHFLNWTYGTIAAYVRKTTDGANMMVLNNQNTAASDSGFGFLINTANKIDLWSNTANSDILSTSTFLSTDGWGIVAVTKATGGTPRAHFYKQQSATPWTHEAMTGAQADNTDVNPTNPNVSISCSSDATQFFVNGDIAAIIALNQQVMTDSEIERLPSGMWDRWLRRTDDFLIEFPSGRDAFVTGVNTSRTVGRGTMRPTATVGTSRAARTDPPGFRFSRYKRRL